MDDDDRMRRAILESRYGHDNVWDKQELERDFEVIQFEAPLVLVKRKADGVEGTLFFDHLPRFYYDWVPI